MSELIVAKEPEDLPAVVDVVHDCWFDKDEIRFDLETATLTIRFIKPAPERGQAVSRSRLLRRVEIPYFESFLRIHHVRKWSVEDSEEVGLYDFNEIEFDRRTNRIEITTGIPIRIVVDVERLEITVEVTETVATVKSHRRLL